MHVTNYSAVTSELTKVKVLYCFSSLKEMKMETKCMNLIYMVRGYISCF